MKIPQILALVKNGYTPNEIAGLTHIDETIELLNNGVKKEDIPDYLNLITDDEADSDGGFSPFTPNEKPAGDPAGGQPPTEEPAGPDYKKLYEEEKAKNQKAAVKKDISGAQPEKSDREIMEESFKNFM